jgi:hypothetical protein
MVFVVIAVLGCTTGNATDDAHDRYALAARSWMGAGIGEMIAAWGDPTRRFELPEGEKEGIAWWESFSEEGGHGGRGKTTRYHCSAVAHFNSNLIISNIEILRSRDCDRLYGSRFESMTRERVELDRTLIKT